MPFKLKKEIWIIKPKAESNPMFSLFLIIELQVSPMVILWVPSILCFYSTRTPYCHQNIHFQRF